jgi:D-alanyl-D-alanine carboxypeptidase/Family of unknown function (DUF5715)
LPDIRRFYKIFDLKNRIFAGYLHRFVLQNHIILTMTKRTSASRSPRRRFSYSVGSILALFALVLLADWLWEWNTRRENRRELEYIATVAPQSALIFQQFITEIETKTGWKIVINSGLRSEEEQEALKKQNSKNAAAERSKHVKGKAIDINLYKKRGLGREWLLKSDSKSAWQKTGAPEIAKQFGLKWGGDFKTYHDPVHFEME